MKFMMHTGFEGDLPYHLLALIVLAIFYAIYFAKILLQKRKGIRTNQIGKNKGKSLKKVEMFMSAATCSVVAVQLMSVACDLNYMPPPARFTGFLLGMTGDGIFLAAVICMKDSWRVGIPKDEKTAMVTDGIYKFSRNPAFLGFDLMYIGVFLMYCNVLTGIFSAFAAVMLHMQILQEEKHMEAEFGAEYTAYKRKVHRYLGRQKEK